MKCFKSLIIARISLSCFILMSGCSSDENKSNGSDITTTTLIQEKIKKSESISGEYKEVKTKLLSDQNISTKDSDLIGFYIEGMFYRSFDNYVSEVNDVFEKYYKIAPDSMLDLLGLPLTVDLNAKNKVKNFEVICSDETYAWILNKLVAVDAYINDYGYDHESFDYKQLVSKSAEIKRVIYYIKGDKENELKYKKIVDELMYIYGWF